MLPRQVIAEISRNGALATQQCDKEYSEQQNIIGVERWATHLAQSFRIPWKQRCRIPKGGEHCDFTNILVYGERILLAVGSPSGKTGPTVFEPTCFNQRPSGHNNMVTIRLRDGDTLLRREKGACGHEVV
jgi:hypothetical protein